MANKVFCVNCAYFNSCKRANARVSYDETDLHEICNAPQNIRATYLSDGSNKYISVPSIINKYNNCTWFTAKTTCHDIAHIIDMHNRDPEAHSVIIEPLKEEIAEQCQAVEYKLDQHKDDKQNPHQVTKAQVGLGNVDNTSDLEKPVSSATTLAIKAETDRASAAEGFLNTKVTQLDTYTKQEVYRLDQSVNNLTISVGSLNSKIDTEITRATNKENALSVKIDETYTNLNTKIEDTSRNIKSYTDTRISETKTYASDQARSYASQAVGTSKTYTDTVAVELRQEIEEKTQYLWRFKGSVDYRRDLDAILIKQYGDVYNVRYDDAGKPWGHNFVWTTEGWDDIGGIIDLENYYTKSQVDGKFTVLESQIDEKFEEFNALINTKLQDYCKTVDVIAKDAQVLVDAKSYTNDKIGTIASDKTVVDVINTSKEEAVETSNTFTKNRLGAIPEDKTVAEVIDESSSGGKTYVDTRLGNIPSDKTVSQVISQSIDTSKSYTNEQINDVKSTYLPLTGNKTIKGSVEFDSNITVKDNELDPNSLTIKAGSLVKKNNSSNSEVVINLPQYSGTLARTADIDSSIGSISEVINEHVLNDTDAHNVDSRLATTLVTAENKSKELDNAQYTKITNETNTKVDNIKNTYLPLTGNKVVTGVVEFQNQLKVKDSVTGSNTLVISTNSLTKKNSDGNPDVVISLPETSGVIAKTSNVSDLRGEIINITDNHNSRITVLEGKIPSDITSSISSTSTSEGKDVPNNYAVRTALTVKANVIDVDNKISEVNTTINTKADKTVVQGIQSTIGDIQTTLGTKADKTVTDAIQATVATKADKTQLDTKADKATTLSGYGITDAYTKTEVDNKVAGTYRVKPSVERYEDLPMEGNQVGDVRNVRTGIYAGANFVWTTEGAWDKLSETIDLSVKQDVATAVKHSENTKVGSSSIPVYVLENGQVFPVTVDSVVTASSNNTVTSGAVYTDVRTYTNNAVSSCATKTELNLKADKTQLNDYLTTIQTRDEIAAAKTSAINHSDDQDAIVKSNCEQYADNKDVNVTTECKNYTDYQIASIHNRHYTIKKVEDTSETPNEYLTTDYTSNNIDLTGKTGDVYIYLPVTSTSLTGKAREMIVNVSNRNVSSCIIHFATKNEESVEFRDGGVLETVKNSKEEFSLKFQEYDTSKFLVDEVGVGDTVNNEKVKINQNQLSLVDSSGDVWKFSVVDGQLKLNKVSV